MNDILMSAAYVMGGYVLRIGLVMIREVARLRFESARAKLLTSVLSAASPGTEVSDARGDGSVITIKVLPSHHTSIGDADAAS
ncbi:hypothetical protein ACGFR6_27535 [Streptomyces sp. NPDC048567]|uniref:hypothetical protein n=1 Tax=Streptomyces sp. NPDC048567 TaxID=3365570 RepID=UPI0037230349